MANLGTAISPAPAVTCLTTGGAVATGYTGDVTVALGTNPTGATLSGTLTVSATAGVATFSDLTLNHSGKNFTLSATASGLRSVTSAAFSIPTQLVFTTQPGAGNTGQTLDQVVVTVRDGAGNTDTEYTGNVTVAIYTASAAGVLSGTLTVAAVAGVATFSTLSISVSGTYTLIASAAEVSTAYTPSSAVSSSFIVAPYILVAGQSGFATGYVQSLIGTLTPTSLNAATITILDSDTLSGGHTVLALAGETYSSNFFTSITVGGTTLLAADATFAVGGGASGWTWDGIELFTSATTYGVTIT